MDHYHYPILFKKIKLDRPYNLISFIVGFDGYELSFELGPLASFADAFPHHSPPSCRVSTVRYYLSYECPKGLR